MFELEAAVMEAKRRGEPVVVVIKNQKTGEEFPTNINPLFIAEIEGQIQA